MACPSCGRGFHDECESGCEVCHPVVEQLIKSFTTPRTSVIGQPTKDPENVTDPKSTGRKRAAQLYPIFKDLPCEWKGQKNCGGGEPIVGCINGLQIDRHHGPVKNTLRNEPGNVHRICKFCHNRWHAVNDPIYDEEKYEKLKHNPEPADEIELVANEAKWRLSK